jgi:hypothetical protein
VLRRGVARASSRNIAGVSRFRRGTFDGSRRGARDCGRDACARHVRRGDARGRPFRRCDDGAPPPAPDDYTARGQAEHRPTPTSARPQPRFENGTPACT